ncbi:RUN and FYVE domain-containing protein 4 [Sorex araneus]|uniref:RUN and FYVE domain-containing protein 4 n=1 Tax=Sorex araneus TaxID=42254 RepID=UPI002433E894|nr:RUN and FYVE domain-containing protein 4 [Sorex araneus]
MGPRSARSPRCAVSPSRADCIAGPGGSYQSRLSGHTRNPSSSWQKRRVPVQMIRDLKDAVTAVLQGYGSGQRPVTDASAELHRLCGCLEQLLQFEQKEQKRFLRARKGYWGFLCTALWQQRGDTESSRFVHSQDKLQTPLGKGRAFIRFCLVHGQLAESLQLCLLDPELTRDWYGPRSPLLCPTLQEDLLDSLYALNGVTFDLDLQRADLDEAWPMFSESCSPSASHIPGRRPRKTRESPKEVLLPAELEEADGKQLQQDSEKGSPRKDACQENSTPGCQGPGPGDPGVLRSLETSADSIQEKPREPAGVAAGTRKEESPAPSAEGEARTDEDLRSPGQALELLLEEREGQLKALQEQLSRCREEKAQLQAQLGQVRLEAERKAATSKEELGRQQDLVRAMKRRVLELVQEKDSQWQKAQQLSPVTPGRCVGCSKVFGRLSRRYPCRLCGGLVCHACSVDYKKRASRCPPCAQNRDPPVS